MAADKREDPHDKRHPRKKRRDGGEHHGHDRPSRAERGDVGRAGPDGGPQPGSQDEHGGADQPGRNTDTERHRFRQPTPATDRDGEGADHEGRHGAREEKRDAARADEAPDLQAVGL